MAGLYLFNDYQDNPTQKLGAPISWHDINEGLTILHSEPMSIQQ